MWEKLRLRYAKTFFFWRHTKKIFEKLRLRDVKTLFFRELNFGTGRARIISLRLGPDFLSTALVWIPN